MAAKDARARALGLFGEDFRVHPGVPLPFGVTRQSRGLNFSVFSRHASAVRLVLFDLHGDEPLLELPLEPPFHRTGDMWHVGVDGLLGDFRYGWRAMRDGDGMSVLHRFDPGVVLLDPYATAVDGRQHWGEGQSRVTSVFPDRTFEWQFDHSPTFPQAERIIYELHVRGFTRVDGSVQHPGTYHALAEKIPYLESLGVTTVELLPVYEFDENECGDRVDPVTGRRLHNFWGYSPLSFFAAKSGYAVAGLPEETADEFRTMIRAFHAAGMEVILDVVFNHTGEGTGRKGDAVSLRGLDNSIYYMIDPVTGADLDFTGCGNTLNCNHPLVRDVILDALRYWVAEMHVDGFRFDLASVLGRGQDGSVLANPPLLERIAEDPVLRDATLIAEAWDAAGLYQVGQFPDRWAEWNGPYRDDVRDFLRGNGTPDRLATRLAGSADLFLSSGRSPAHSINFITSHDGFTLRDLVSYERKHNHRNGEESRDGTDDNRSWNCGVEGESDDPAIEALRRRQVRNFLTLLLVSQGTPMLLAGDELGRTQRGNNNAYCQDNELSWVQWDAADEELLAFTRRLIAFRKETPAVRRDTFLRGATSPRTGRMDVTWHGARLGQPEFGTSARVLAMHLGGEQLTPADRDVYVAVNAWMGEVAFELPDPPEGEVWQLLFDTSRPEVTEALQGVRSYALAAHSCLVLRSL
ncbi:MAG: isoamylase, partial [Acidobacteriota bacterium]